MAVQLSVFRMLFVSMTVSSENISLVSSSFFFFFAPRQPYIYFFFHLVIKVFAILVAYL